MSSIQKAGALHSRDAVSKLLDRALGRNSKRATRPGKIARTAPSNVDVTSRELCDKTVEYLAPSLEAYKGCTIIDIHPGACQWSASLHDYLQPKRHLLMEPDKRYLKPFIKPLLDQPGSTYRHTTLSGAHPRSYWENYRVVFESEKLLGPRSTVAPDELKLREVDTSILVTGNLARRYTDAVRLPNMVPFVHLIMQHLTWAALTNTVIHDTGMLRMLFWLPEAHKEQIIPPMTTNRSAFNMGLNMGADINEIVGFEPAYQLFLNRKARTYHRPLEMIEAGNLAVAQRMEQDNRVEPRNDPLLQYLPKDKAQTAAKSIVDTPDETREEFEAAIQKFETRMEDIIETYRRYSLTGNTRQKALMAKAADQYLLSIEYPQSLEAIHVVKERTRVGAKAVKVVLYVDLFCQLINLEARYCALRDKGVDVAPLKERLFAFDERLRADIQSYRKLGMMPIDERIEDQLAFFATPQVIPWDRRRFEPLQAQAQDFWKHYPLTLLDITPVAGRDLSVPGIASHREVAMTCQQLLKYLYQGRATPLTAALDSIAPHAAQDLIPLVPAITDPRKGGRLNPHRFITRMLSEDMVIGLVKAWFGWPFRPTRGQLEQATFSFNAIDSDDYHSHDVFGDEEDV